MSKLPKNLIQCMNTNAKIIPKELLGSLFAIEDLIHFFLGKVDHLASPQKTCQKYSSTLEIACVYARIKQWAPATVVLATNATKNLPIVMFCLSERRIQPKISS